MEQGQEPVFQMPGFDPAQLMFKNKFSKQKLSKLLKFKKNPTERHPLGEVF